MCVNRVELVFEVVFEGCEACDGVWGSCGTRPLRFTLPDAQSKDT